MSDHRDDDFRIRPGVPKNRGQGFVSKVLKQVGKTSGGKSAMRRPASTGNTGKHAGQRPGSRLGRGHTAARFAGAKLTPLSRRVTIKSLLVNQRQVSPQSLSKHLRYIERDGAGRDGEPGPAYGPQADEADLDAFKERCADDRHHFRFIVSPEEGGDLDDLRTYTRHLMNRMEADLGTRLEWVAVDHWNTDNPHSQVVMAKATLGAVVTAALAVSTGEPWPSLSAALGLLAVGATGYGLSLRFYLLAQRAFGAARTGSVFAFAPFIGAAVAFGFGDRPAGLLMLLGGVLMLAGVVLHLAESHGHEHTHEVLEHEHAHRHDDGHHSHLHDVMPKGSHSHKHTHEPMTHAHPHAPDVHHQHVH